MLAGRSLEDLRTIHGDRYRWLLLVTVMVGTISSVFMLAATCSMLAWSCCPGGWRMDVHGATLSGGDSALPQRLRAFDETFVGVALVCAVAALLALRMRPAAPLGR